MSFLYNKKKFVNSIKCFSKHSINGVNALPIMCIQQNGRPMVTSLQATCVTSIVI